MKLSSLVITELKNLSAASRLQMQTQGMSPHPSATAAVTGTSGASGIAAAAGTTATPMETVNTTHK
jgi:hypothetical protein